MFVRKKVKEGKKCFEQIIQDSVLGTDYDNGKDAVYNEYDHNTNKL